MAECFALYNPSSVAYGDSFPQGKPKKCLRLVQLSPKGSLKDAHPYANNITIPFYGGTYGSHKEESKAG